MKLSDDDDTITVEAWVFLGLLVTEMRKAAGNAEETNALADRVNDIAKAMQRIATKKRTKDHRP